MVTLGGSLPQARCLIASLCFAVGCLSSLQLEAQPRQRDANARYFHEKREARFSFDEIDYSALYEEGRWRRPDLDPPDMEQIVRENVRFVFINLLNRHRFLVTPAPDHMVVKVEQVLRLDREIRQLLKGGEQLLLEESRKSSRRRRELVRQIGEKAHEIRKIFETYFSEYSNEPILIKLMASESAEHTFRDFLRRSEQIGRELTLRLNEYFFQGAPAVVDVNAFQKHSVQVLSESLQQLSKVTLRHL